jgi:multidrug resistance efflux pump
MNANGFAHPISPRRFWLKSVEARIEGQVVEVTANMHGCVDRVLAAEDGLVEKGQLLVELDRRELDRKIEAAAVELDRTLFASMVVNGHPANPHQSLMLSRVEFASSPDVTRARGRYLQARLNRLSADVRAPVAGRVLARNVQPREFIALSQPLVSILDSNDLWVLARFGAQDFGRLRVGQHASVRAGGRTFTARLAGLVSPEEPALLEFVPRPAAALRPGMIAATAVAAD